MPTVYMVPADKLIDKLASYLRENIDEVAPPAWALTSKTAAHREHLPHNRGWWYTRCASLLRKLYLHSSIGVSRLRKEYGGRKRRGRKKEHTWPGGGSSVREPLQQLEKAGLVEIMEKKGRRLTSNGRSLLDRLATEVYKESTTEPKRSGRQ